MKSVRWALVLLSMGIAVADPLPESLDRDEIATTMNSLKPDILACANKLAHPKDVVVKLRLDVAPAGHTASVTVDGAISDALKSCIADAAKKGTYPATQKGARFSYPFVF